MFRFERVGRLTSAVAFILAVLAGAAALAASAQETAPGRLDVRKQAFDGGEVRFDGTYYDFRAANGVQHMTMWVPPGPEPLRGILFHGNPGGYGDTRDIPRDPSLQEFAARHRFGIIGVTSFPGGQVYDQLASVVVGALNDWASLGYHPEIANLPMIARGSSNAGVTAYSLACYVPERMICFTPNVGPRYNPASPPDAVLHVPALLHVGPRDPFFTDGVERTRDLFADARPRGARWAWTAEEGKGHEIGYIDDIDMKFYETCIALRLPPDADPRNGPVQLRDLPEESGWLVDQSSWESGITRIAPYADYEGDKSAAGWVPTADIAYLYRAIATYGNPLAVSVKGLAAVENPNESGVFLRSVGGSVVDPGERIAVQCDAAKFPDWQRIEFYDGASPLGEVVAGQEPAIELTVKPEQTVYAVSALAYGPDGAVRTSPPAYFLVRDPALSATLVAQREAHDALPPPAPRLVLGSSAADQPAQTVEPETADDQVLVAYGLTAEQEGEFAVDGRMSPFWSGFTAEEDSAVLTVADDLAADDQARGTAAAEGDAEVTVHAAHTRAGLYLLFEVTDDQWSAPADLQDALDFHIARDSSQAIWAAEPAQMFVKRESWGCVLSAVQFQVNLGNDESPPTSVAVQYPDPWAIVRTEVPFAAAAERYGILVDCQTLASDRKAVEMFIPWAYVGRGAESAEPPVGHRFGLSLGYNDHDEGQNAAGENDRLRSSNRTDPWWQAGDRGPNPNPWGDLEIGPMLGR